MPVKDIFIAFLTILLLQPLIKGKFIVKEEVNGCLTHVVEKKDALKIFKVPVIIPLFSKNMLNKKLQNTGVVQHQGTLDCLLARELDCEYEFASEILRNIRLHLILPA